MNRVQEIIDNDMPPREACKIVGINYATFYGYRKRLKLEAASPTAVGYKAHELAVGDLFT